jgi:V/A-type H+/Na+-transporting ATPase subunit E
VEAGNSYPQRKVAMAELEKAQERIQAICEKIKLETLDPARLEAQVIIDDAHKEAKKIVEQAKREAEKTREETKKSLEEEKRIFTSSLEQAAKQSVELVKQKIEQSLFNPALEKWVIEQLGNARDTAKLIECVIEAINKEGLQVDLAAKIPQTFTPDEIVANLSSQILKQLKTGAIEVSDIKGGAQIEIKNKHLMLDLSDTTFKELISSFVRKDFRKIFFAT